MVIFGNHSFYFEAHPEQRTLVSNATLLLHEAITIEGLKIFGSPMTPLYGAAFGRSSSSDRQEHWAEVPDDTNVLVTHGPPLGILDVSPGNPERMGDPDLLARVRELEELRLHCFGHVHGAYGQTDEFVVTFVNAALMGPFGELENKPVALRMTQF